MYHGKGGGCSNMVRGMQCNMVRGVCSNMIRGMQCIMVRGVQLHGKVDTV